ncbi:MAG TPA: hypothetical protein VH020_09375 [Stellaceae bacterium]|jgi:hypothetical protein|nr:hypothetical protein [Stellaceae bacterium]
MSESRQKVGRLALRAEGDNWNAYYALEHTMADAISLGSIRLGAVIDNPKRKQAFMDLMRDVVSDIIADKIGVRPSWGDPESAPEHERSGNA